MNLPELKFQSNEIRLKKVAEFARGKVLDIGFAGNPNKYLNGEVIGFDLENPEDRPYNYTKVIQGDVRHLTKHFKPNSLDCIIASEFIEHIDSHVNFFKDCYFLLKEGGSLVLSTPTPYYYRTLLGNIFFLHGHSIMEKHISIYVPRILNNLAKKIGFKLVEIKAGSRFYIPFLTWQLIYVYEKRGRKE